MKIVNKKCSLLIVCFLTVVCSCDVNTLIDSNIDLPKQGWTRNDIVPFSFVVSDTTESYNFYFSLRHTLDYPFMNAFFLIYTKFPDNTQKIDTIECILSDYQGKWIGKGFGKYRSSEYLVKSSIKFPLAGEYVMKVKQALRIDTVRDITSIGIKIIPN